jgi:hypothetical protein
MAQAQSVVVPGHAREQFRVVKYGQLENEPYAQKGWWFVSIRDWRKGRESTTTFFVPRIEATPVAIRRRGQDLESWREVALQEIRGDWSPEFEMLWEDIPYFIHVFPDGATARYGVSRTPDHREGREGEYHWYLVIAPGVEDPEFDRFAYNTVIIPEEFANPEFMDRVGSDITDWAHSFSYERPASDKDPRIRLGNIDVEPTPDWFFNHLRPLREKKPTWWEKILSWFFS